MAGEKGRKEGNAIIFGAARALNPVPAGLETSAAPQRILVLYWKDLFRPLRPTIMQHLQLFETSPVRHELFYFNVRLGQPRWLPRASFDVIVLHTTLLGARWFAFADEVRQQLAWLTNSPAYKVALPQDEYDHAAILDDWLTDWRVQLIGTNFTNGVRPELYPRAHTSASFLEVLTGYIDSRTIIHVQKHVRPMAERPLDVVYRASKLPYSFGSHGQLKHRIATVTQELAATLGLKTDISVAPQDTILSNKWYAFLASGRATIGCESGSSALDYRGELHQAIKAMLAANPSLSFEDVSSALPAGWDSHRFFALSPRHLEAVLTHTCQLLVEGEYNGLLQANRHYLPIRKDFQNLRDVLLATQDTARMTQLAQHAYEDLFAAGKLTYASMTHALEKHFPTPATRGPLNSVLLRWRLRTWVATKVAWRSLKAVARRVKRKFGLARG